MDTKNALQGLGGCVAIVPLHHKKFNPLKKRCNYRKLLRDWYAALRGLFWL